MVNLDGMVIVAMAPFYAAAVGATYYGLAFMAHKLEQMTRSATETQMTETTSPASTQQK
jgi:hypothetical protein